MLGGLDAHRDLPPIPPRGRTSPGAISGLILAAGLVVAACRSPAGYREEADRAVDSIVRDFAGAFPDVAAFQAERPADRLRSRILEAEALGLEPVLPPLGLSEVLDIASRNSRDYQDSREALYLTALDLTLERWTFSVQESGVLGALLSGDGDQARSASFFSDFGLVRLLQTGGLLVGNVGIDLVRDLTNGDGFEAVSDFFVNFSQPFLRGFGADVVREPLTQAERDVLYQVRSFVRFRRTFAFDVASRYYRILEQADTLQNEQQNFERLVQIRQRNESFAEAGRLSDIQVDQARQDELRARNRVVDARRELEGSLDDFKFFLGLPIGTPIQLDPAELARLESWDELRIVADEERAVEVALRERLDHRNVLGGVEDAERRLVVAADALRAGLDLTVMASGESDAGQPFDFRDQNVGWSAELALDLPLDRLPERNAYRASLIALDVARRRAEESADSIRAGLRDSLRRVSASRESYEIQSGAVALAERRVESAGLNLEAGRASTRDLLEAQESLVQARNAATRALIDFTLAELSFYLDVELLRVDEDGIDVHPTPLVDEETGA